MEAQTLNTVVRRLRLAVDPAVRQSDGELLHLFVKRRDATAFAEIIRRHGPMVLGVCRRVLRDSVDADDAFQATFLVLIRRAASLHSPDQLAGWLHQVALRTSRKHLAVRIARQKREGKLFDVPSGEEPAEVVWRELRPIFDEELGRMPDKLRLPAVLCFLEGLSKSEAARVLGWPEGTVSGRLQRARERLRLRFAARGLTLSSGALAVTLFEGMGSAAISQPLFESALRLIAQPTLASGAAQTLANGVIQAMFITKAKTLVAAVLMVGIIGSGTGGVLVPGNGPGEVVAAETPKDTPAKQPPPAAREDKARMDQRKRELIAMEALIQQLEKIVQKTEEGVKRGVIPETELLNSQATLLRYKLELAKLNEPSKSDAGEADSSKAKEAQHAAMEKLLRQMEGIVEKTADGVRRGIIPQQELNNSELTLLKYRFKLLEQIDPGRKRSEMEEIIKKMEQVVEKTAEGVRKNIVPQQELLNVEQAVLEQKFRLLELSDPPGDQSRSREHSTKPAEIRQALIDLKASELKEAERMFAVKAASQEEVRRIRINLNRLQAEAAEASGDYSASLKHREAVTEELATMLTNTKALVDQKAAPQSELRAIQAALASAKIEACQSAIRKQLADIVAIREQELREAKTLFEAKAISGEDLRYAERSLAEAKLRLAEGR